MNLVYNTVLHFTVDMTKAINEGTFDPEADFVDVAGSFNDWGGSAQLKADGDNVYSIDIVNVKPADAISYKFRINGSWDSNEFPGDLPNREYTAIYGWQLVHHFYDITVGLENISFDEIRYYPNPVKNELIMENVDILDRVLITNLVGQEVMRMEQTQPRMKISTEGLESGVYFLTFVAKDGSQRTEKIIKQ